MDEGVTIIVPSYEEPEVWETVDRLRAACVDQPIEIIVQNDWGSGVGATLRRGVECATTPWVLFAMADGSESPAAVRRMIETTRAVDLDDQPLDAVFGNRWGPGGSVTGYPRVKRIANRLGNCGLAIAAGEVWYTDWTDLAKAYRREWLLQLDWDADFRCAVQIPLRYVRRWPRVAVVPMQWSERTAGTSSYTVGQAMKVLGAAVKEVL